MSFFGGVVKIGLAAGAAYSLKKISDKYNANKPGAGASSEEKTEAYKQAAIEYYNETAELIREKAPAVKESVSSGVQQAADFAEEKFPTVTAKIQEGVDKAADYAEEKLPGVTAKVHEIVDTVAEKIAGFVESRPAASAAEDFDAVVDASVDFAAEEADIEVEIEELTEGTQK